MDQGPEIDLHKKRLETQLVQAELYTTLLEQLRQRLFGKTPGPSSKTDISSRSSVPVHRKTPLEFSSLASPELIADHQLESTINEVQPQEDVASTELHDAPPPLAPTTTPRPRSVISILIAVLVGATLLGVLFAWSLLSGGSSESTAADSIPAQIDSE